MRVVGMSFLMFWVGVILWLGAECNQECRSIYSSECDIPTGAWVLGTVFAFATLIYVVSGQYDRDNKK